ncbi:hypothetical protein I3843_08G046000 [Carya illinoinensis]|uniref:Photolyase/cryptochrome alpha/beta domain-containing protein n=1 Tax=Carya illinoinensis TaxID=32201 RepID=A0A922E8Q1_CARIL|nr:hypothetical protein I3760_08G046700 [Carya illinoinensis]KAG6698971.1 hypothetical protein I3842_08G046400 [Carya illinoinensis]KAG7966344.1 hypothetical protein I3843_08G046000 [Carya illinoinensis]
MSGGGCSIVWFRRDLRLEDNPALAAGVRAGAVVPVFIWAPEEEGHFHPGRVSRWWLKNSLAHLDSSLRSLGTFLVTKRSTDSVSSLLEVVKSTGATQVFFNHLYDPLSLVRDHRAKEVLSAQGIAVRSFNADLLYEPWDVNDAYGQPFTTFASFWERCLSMPYDPEAPLLPPKRIISGDVSRCPSDALIFEDESEKGSNALLARAWSPGWSNADKALTTFINGPLLEYSKNRRKADSATTSFLSPHLHFGEVSVRKVFHLVRIKQVLQLPWRWGMKYFWDTLLDADLESDALGWQYISGTVPDGREFDRIDNPQFQGYKFDPNGEYVRRWLPELARLPTEWIHHPWNAPESVLQAAGIELGSNYPLPIVEIDAAKARLQEALSEMWQQESASRAAIENGTEEGLGESDSTPIAFPQDIQMEENLEPVRNNPSTTIRRYEDQMVPSMTSSLVRVEEEEPSVDLQNLAVDNRGEVPTNLNGNQEAMRNTLNQPVLQTVRRDNLPQFGTPTVLRNGPEDSTAESSSSSRRERDGGVVPVWSPSTPTYSEQFVGDESYLPRHPQSHQILNWRQLSQTG